MKSLAFAGELFRSSALKYSLEKGIILHFVSFYTIFYQISSIFWPILLILVLFYDKNFAGILGNNFLLFFIWPRFTKVGK